MDAAISIGQMADALKGAGYSDEEIKNIIKVTEEYEQEQKKMRARATYWKGESVRAKKLLETYARAVLGK